MTHFSRQCLSPLACLIGLTAMGLTLAGCSQAEPNSHGVEKEIALSPPLETQDEAKDKTHEPTQAKEAGLEPSPPTTSTVRSADSHVHGGATLSIVSEAERVFVELETPLYNLLGFEYAPQTPEEKARVSDIETRLSQPLNLIVFNKDAKCTYDEVNTHIRLFETTPSNDAPSHGAEDSHDHDHKNEHAHETETHTHSEADEHDHSSGHKDIILSYSLTCDDLSKLSTVQVRFFENFPNFTKLDLVYLGPSQQMSTELSPSKSKADLTR